MSRLLAIAFFVLAFVGLAGQASADPPHTGGGIVQDGIILHDAVPVDGGTASTS